MAWSPDGQTLAAAGWLEWFGGFGWSFIELYNPNTRSIKQVLNGHDDQVSSIAFHPNGQILICASFDKTIRIWETSDRFDVTGNGRVDINDLVEVARNYGKTVAGSANPKADVNGDGRVDIEDLTLIARRVNDDFAAPTQSPEASELPFTAIEVQQWVRDAKAMAVNAEGIAVLE